MKTSYDELGSACVAVVHVLYNMNFIKISLRYFQPAKEKHELVSGKLLI